MFTFVGVLSFVRKYSAHTYDLGFSLIRTQQILDYYGNIQKDLDIIISLAPACFDVFSFTWNTEKTSASQMKAQTHRTETTGVSSCFLKLG